jgi:hypothetical protein
MRQLLRPTTTRNDAPGQRTAPASAEGGALRSVKRSARYLSAAGALDIRGQAHIDPTAVVEAIGAEFALGETQPVGLLAECFLGEPYPVLALTGNIVRHYRVGEALPTPYGGARKLALLPAYLAIEVYVDRYACLRADGTVVEVPEAKV